MNKNQQSDFIPVKLPKSSDLYEEINEKYSKKKDLNGRATEYLFKHLSLPALERVDTCHDFMRFLTNADLTKRRLERTNSCGNRFCPICTWKNARKDAIKLCVIAEAIEKIQGYEFIFLTLTSPNVQEDELYDEITHFNNAISKLFRRKKVMNGIEGYVRKLEVTTDQEKFITDDLYKRKKEYFDPRGLKVGDANPQYNTYNPHVHMILSVKKSYFKKNFISHEEWLEMWKSCMKDDRICMIKVNKVRANSKGKNGKNGAILEVAKYTAKGNELYHSERVFDTFYTALKGRQLLVYSGIFKDYAKKYEQGLLDEFKHKDETLYTHMLKSLWKSSKYENALRELTEDEFKQYNERALTIEEDDAIDALDE